MKFKGKTLGWVYIRKSLCILVISILLVHVFNFNVNILSGSDFQALWVYCGVLLGFALTVYTFGLQLLFDIRDKLKAAKSIEANSKTQILGLLELAFEEIRDDVLLIFGAMILTVGLEMVKDVPNPFGWDVTSWMVPEVGRVFLFGIATYSIYDILQAIFGLPGIRMKIEEIENR